MENKNLVYQKISEVMSAVDAVGKDRKNTLQNYSFRGIDDMYNALNVHLSKAKIFFTSDIISKEREERQTKAGGNLIYTILTIKWTIFAEDGSFVNTTTVGEAMDSGDKSANKAMSAAYKYALMQVFCIPTSDTKDTEAETHEVAKKEPTKEFHLTPDASTAPKCTSCDGPTKFSSKSGRWYCAALCWKNPVVKEEPEPQYPDQPPFEG